MQPRIPPRRAASLLALLLAASTAGCFPAAAELVVANGPDVQVLDPQRASASPDGRVLAALYAGLTRLDPRTLAPEPGLAEEFAQSGGGRVWTFRLRAGLRWSDGSALTVDDVVASWRRLLDPATASPWREWLEDLDGDAGLRVTGERELTVRFRHPFPAFGEICAHHALAPVHARVRAAHGATAASDVQSAPVSGPFTLVSRKVRDRVRVARNPLYWDAADVRLQSVDFLTVESQFTALNLFLAGAVHYSAGDVPALAVPALEARARAAAPVPAGGVAEFAPAPFWGTDFYRFQTGAPPFDDARVRQAFAMAVDREALAATLGGGRRAAWSFVPPDGSGYALPEGPRFDPAAARALLAAAGHPDGAAMPPVELLFNSAELHRDVAEVLQAQWREHLGVAVRLQNQEWRVVLDAQRRLRYQISRSSWIGDYLDPATFLEIFRPDSPNNRTGWADAGYVADLDAARSAPDPGRRNAALRRAEARLLAEAPILPLFHYSRMDLASPRLRGFHRNLRGWIDWGRLALAED
ncbi:MAG TPA: peptide ABC transporter substrate-binding protein [Planctomycetota bacterium]